MAVFNTYTLINTFDEFFDKLFILCTNRSLTQGACECDGTIVKKRNSKLTKEEIRNENKKGCRTVQAKDIRYLMKLFNIENFAKFSQPSEFIEAIKTWKKKAEKELEFDIWVPERIPQFITIMYGCGIDDLLEKENDEEEKMGAEDSDPDGLGYSDDSDDSDDSDELERMTQYMDAEDVMYYYFIKSLHTDFDVEIEPNCIAARKMKKLAEQGSTMNEGKHLEEIKKEFDCANFRRMEECNLWDKLADLENHDYKECNCEWCLHYRLLIPSDVMECFEKMHLD